MVDKSRDNQVRQITDAQSGIHTNLASLVSKHFAKTYKKPIAQHTQDAFDAIKPTVIKAKQEGKALIFDSGCGTAVSTHRIASTYPQSLVLGIDRSAARLSKVYNQALPDNAHLIQADCVDFWLLAQQAGWHLSRHYLLYPNPYPKAKHVKRRWHAHPVFPTLLALGGDLELRTNWRVYAEEFCMALALSPANKQVSQGLEIIQPDKPMTLFEKKYQDNGQELYRCRISL